MNFPIIKLKSSWQLKEHSIDNALYNNAKLNWPYPYHRIQRLETLKNIPCQ